jgi:hypothetical protein
MHRALSALISLVILLSGCGGSSGGSIQQNSPSSPLPGATITGTLYVNGQPQASGAHVYLLTANITGYGQASVSLLSAAATGTSDSVGAYVLTGANGSFTLPGGYTCTPDQQVYIYVFGGANPVAGLLAVIGNCPTSSLSVTVNEATTVAAAYALAGFATDSTHVSSSGTPLAQTGIATAFANAANLVSISNGAALATTPMGKGTVPQSEINTLARILSSCVSSTGTVNGPANPTACYTLFHNAESAGSSGTVPSDTATAAIHIAHNPGSNIAALYALAASTQTFTPALTAQPNDFTIAIQFTGGDLPSPTAIAIDGSGDVWIANNDYIGTITKLSSIGTPIFSAGYNGDGLVAPLGMAIDLSGNAWITYPVNDSVAEISKNGVAISPYAGYIGGGLNMPAGIAIDGSGDVWAANYASVSELSSAGVPISPSPGYTGGLSASNWYQNIAIDPSGNTWIPNYYTSRVTKLSASGSAVSPSNGYSGGGLYEPVGIAIDGLGNVWVANNQTSSPTQSGLSELSSSGVAISPSTGYTGGGLYAPYVIAIDGSGNVWVANRNATISEFSNSGIALSPPNGYGGFRLDGDELATIAVDGSGDLWVANEDFGLVADSIGAATPVVTPLAAGVKSNTLGTRP